MPTYRYRCEGCGDEYEVWQSITDDALTSHDGDDGCGGHVAKVLSPAGIVLKGSGFYKTDSRGGRKSSPSTNGDGSKDSSTSTDGSSSDSSSSSPSSGSSDSSGSSGSMGAKDSGSKPSTTKSS